jgi:glycosyltransferase involved in cell wall biosynthesis
MNLRVGFMMDQIAGHITNYHNLRSVTTKDPEIQAVWNEISYYRQGGSIEKLRERVLPFIPSYFSGNARGAFEMWRGLKHQSYEAIYSNASVGVFFSSTFRKIPSLIDFDSTPLQLDQMEAYTAHPDPRPIAYLKWQLSRNMFHSATILQAWSRWAKQSAITDYGVPAQKIVVNPPGVNLDFWKPGPLPTTEAGCPLRILFVGGDFRRKGGQLLLDWHKTQRPEQCELHVVTREPVETQPGLFIYHDMQPNTDRLLQLYLQSDLFVLPSLGECFGIATVEAMATGLPVIASDVGGTADIIEPGRNGYIVKGGNLADLAAAINAILSNPNLRASMRTQSRQIAEELFNVETNARQTLSYLKQIANRSTQHRPASSTRSL